MKLQTLLNHFKVTSTGFPAFAALGEHSKGTDKATLSTLPAAVLASQGVKEYYSPIIPRDSKFMTVEDVLQADLDVRKYRIEMVDKLDMLKYANPIDTVIVSRHKGTIDHILKDFTLIQRPQVLDGNITADDIKGKHVIGTLPPHLITECDVYTAISIKDFDYANDGDLHGEELARRIVINDPIKLREIVLKLDFIDGEYHLTIDKETFEKVVFGKRESVCDVVIYNDSRNSSCFYGSDMCIRVDNYKTYALSVYINEEILYDAHKDFDRFLENYKLQILEDVSSVDKIIIV